MVYVDICDPYSRCTWCELDAVVVIDMGNEPCMLLGCEQCQEHLEQYIEINNYGMWRKYVTHFVRDEQC